VGPNANRLHVQALLLNAPYKEQLHWHLRHQELGDVGSRFGDLNMPAGFTPYI
jgi:hypothetical protein